MSKKAECSSIKAYKIFFKAANTGAGVTFDLTFFDNSKVIDFDD